jgi:hypothetical protein
MFSREEKKILNTAFFNQFVRRMSRHHSLGGGGGRWESYKTGVKGLYFRMLTAPIVGIAIDIQQKDPEIRVLLFDQFIELRRLLEAEWGDDVVLRIFTLFRKWCGSVKNCYNTRERLFL